MKLKADLAHQFECGLQLRATAEEAGPGQHIESQPSSRHGHYQSTHIPQMADVLGTHQGEDDIIILLPLVAVHCGHLWSTRRVLYSLPILPLFNKLRKVISRKCIPFQATQRQGSLHSVWPAHL